MLRRHVLIDGSWSPNANKHGAPCSLSTQQNVQRVPSCDCVFLVCLFARPLRLPSRHADPPLIPPCAFKNSKRVVEGVARVKQGDGGSHSPTESRRIQRANMNLLNKLNGIQRKGGMTNSWQAQPICKHKTTSAVNRLSSQRKIEGQNMVRKLRKARVCGACRGAGRG